MDKKQYDEPYRDYNKDIVITGTLGRDGAYKFYREKYGRNKISDNQYYKICQSFNEAVSDKIVKESFIFRMPRRLGFINIVKNKIKIKVVDGKLDTSKMIVNWRATWEYWNNKYEGMTRDEIKAVKGKKLVFQTNQHTDGDIMKFYWNKISCNVPNHTVYRFKPIKTNRFKLADWIWNKNRINDYPTK